MIRTKRNNPKRERENTIALINVVFLMLIFFLIAGSLAPSPDREVELVSLTEAIRTSPPDMLFLREDGTPSWGGESITLADSVQRWKDRLTSAETPFRLAIDKNLEANKLLDVVEELRRSGVGEIRLITLLDSGQ